MSKKLIKVFGLLIAVAMLLAVMPKGQVEAQGTTINVGVLDPSWTAPGGGGVFAAYIGPTAYAYVIPGSTALFDGREAGIIKAGINIDPESGHYEDEGLLAFKVNNVAILTFASQALTYDVQNESGTNPVWVRIRIVGGTTFQHLPASYGVGEGYHVIDAAAGSWQLMDSNGNATGPMMTLAELATAYPTAVVDRVYLTLGMGDSYYVSPGVGTVGWVDKVVIDTVTYDFVVIPTTLCSTDCYVDAVNGNDTFPGTADFPMKTIQEGINAVGAGGTVYVAAGTYFESQGGWRDITIAKSVSIIGAGSTQTIVELSGLQNGVIVTADATGVVYLEGIKFTKHGTNVNSAGWPIRIGGAGQTFTSVTLKDIDVSYADARNLHFEATSTTYGSIFIENCKVHHSDIWGASIAGPANEVTVVNSDFTNNGKDDPLHGYGLDFESPYILKTRVIGGNFSYNFGPGININSLHDAIFDGVSASSNGNFNASVANYEVGVNLWDSTGDGSDEVVFKNSTFANNERGGIALGNQGTLTTGPITIESSMITGNGLHAILTWFTSSAANPYTGISIHHNRIINAGTTLIGNIVNGLTIGDNWWGCNEGFGKPGCSGGTWCSAGSFTIPSHLVMNVSAAPAFTPGANSTFTADLKYNNVPEDTSAAGYLPPATVGFTPTANVAPDSADLASGVASTVFSAPMPIGSFDVCATLDAETVCLPYTHGIPTITYADDSWIGLPDGTPVTVGTETHVIGYDAFDTILEAKTAVVANGGTVRVLAGTYNEAVLLDKLYLTVESIDGAATTIIDVPDGTLTTGVKTFANLGVITFDGFTVRGFTEAGIIQGMSQATGTTFHVLNNIVIPDNDYLRNGIQVTGDGSTVIGNQVLGQYLTEDWGSTAIGVVNASNVIVQNNIVTGPGDYGISVYTWGAFSDSNIQVLGNTITGFYAGVNIDAYQGGSVSNLDVHQNKITNYHTGIIARPYPGYGGVSVTDVDASLNYWGSACGPSLVEGDAVIAPWYTDAALTNTSSTLPVAGTFTFDAGATTAQMQEIINCAAPGSILNFVSGSYPGGLVVGRDQLTFNLNSVTVGAGSPAFDIYGDDIVINGPGRFVGAGATAADPAIYINPGADNFILDGVEITGWTDGVYVGGDVESLKIVNNWIHTNLESALEVDGTPTGVVTIEGNLFKANTGVAVVYGGTGTLDATYNSWGAITGPTGLASNVRATPFNYYELYFDMDPVLTAEQIERRVANQETFDIVLKADAVDVYGLSFVYQYDTTKLQLINTTLDPYWGEFSEYGRCEVIPGLLTGQVGYYCFQYNTTAEWDGGNIATFTFKAIDSGTTYFDVLVDEDLTAGAVAGVKVWVNNAGYNLPSVETRLLTDIDDGKLIIDAISNFTGFIDLEGRPNDSGALVQVFDAASAGTLKATALSESSGKYTTAYVTGQWMVVSVLPDYSVPYVIMIDRALFLPILVKTQPLTSSPLHTLVTLVLLGGDGTDDNLIDIADASCIGNAYGTSTNVCSGGAGANSDVNGDGIVNIYDLTLMGGNFTKTFSPWY